MGVIEPWVETFVVGVLQMRCSIVTDRKTGDTVIIDGGVSPTELSIGLMVLME